jgi:malic enzyme
MYIENEKEVNKIIKDMYKRNLKALDELVQNKKKDNFVGMSENEKAMNRDLIQKAYQDDNDEDNI